MADIWLKRLPRAQIDFIKFLIDAIIRGNKSEDIRQVSHVSVKSLISLTYNFPRFPEIQKNLSSARRKRKNLFSPNIAQIRS